MYDVINDVQEHCHRNINSIISFLFLNIDRYNIRRSGNFDVLETCFYFLI